MQRLFLVIILATTVAPAAWGQTPPASQYRQPGETIEADPVRQLGILEAALRFYRPSGAQSRWIDGTLLSSTPNSDPATLLPAVVDTLVERLGRGRFCASDARDACRYRQGGRLRTSAPYLIDQTHARVVVAFESVWPYGPSIVSYQTIWLVHDPMGWRIERRGVAQ
jgi:hypothetical protein